MQRHTSTPRPDWENIVKSQGLAYSETISPNGTINHYWNESAYYQFTMDEVTELEKVTENLHRMSLEAAQFLAEESGKTGSPWNLGIPDYAVEYARESLRRGDKDFYGRFDLVYKDENSPAKMLEYNADTPTGLVEAAICQWYWYENMFPRDEYPSHDQWNSIHESLIAQWQRIFKNRSGELLHFAHTDADESGEDIMTVAYLRDCAEQAGITTRGLTMTDIGYDHTFQRFVDMENKLITNIFKLYPWEDMMHEEFGPHLARLRSSGWYEPAWKMFLSTKALPAALWHLFPDHENLLPTYMNEQRDLTEYVKKPLHGREGSNISIHADRVNMETGGAWGTEGHVYQQWHPLPNFEGPNGEPNHPVIGSWVVNGESVGVGIRESDGYITDYSCRFVPNLIWDEYLF